MNGRTDFSDPEVVEVMRQLCQRDLKFICQSALGMSDWDGCHDDLLAWRNDHRDSRFRMYLMPRGWLKTSILTVAQTIQDILNNPDITILLSSAVWNNSRSFLYSIADENMGYLTRKSILPIIFGNFISTKWTQDGIVVRQRTKAEKTQTIETAGIDKVLTSQHYDVIRADDLVTRETTTTAEQIEKVKNHIKDLFKLLNPGGQMDVIGTRWDDQDAYRWIQEELTDPRLGTEAFAIYSTGPYDKDGNSNFQRKFTNEKLAAMKIKVGSYEFSCNYENNPSSPTNRIFNPPVRYFESLPAVIGRAVLIDPAISKKKDSCDAVVADVGITPERQMIVCEYAIFAGDKKHPSNIIEKAIEMCLRGGAHVIGVEGTAYQEVLAILIGDEIRKRNLDIEVIAIHNDDDKARRIICLQPFWEQGNLLVKRGMVEIEEQFDKFRKPITAKVDILDAVSMRLKVPEDKIVWSHSRSRLHAHPAFSGQNLLPNPHAGRALPESEWKKLQRQHDARR